MSLHINFSLDKHNVIICLDKHSHYITFCLDKHTVITINESQQQCIRLFRLSLSYITFPVSLTGFKNNKIVA